MNPQLEVDGTMRLDITVRPLQEEDLPVADSIFRLAFGTFIGLPEPTAFMGDADYVRTRWLADPTGAFAAEVGGELIGSNFVTGWGSVGFLGPLTIRPDFWGRGVGKRLIEPAMALLDQRGTKHAGLFTFAHSPKHLGLYQKFGFCPRFLTAIMSKPVEPARRATGWTGFSQVPANEQDAILLACRELTGALYEGLDVGHEVRAIMTQDLGETILLWDDDGLVGMAACHTGPGTEAGSGVCYIKFGAVRPGPAAERDFSRLLHACEEMASARNLSRLVAGINTARYEAYRRMLALGFITDVQGVAMSRPNEAGYNQPDIYLIDDWR